MEDVNKEDENGWGVDFHNTTIQIWEIKFSNNTNKIQLHGVHFKKRAPNAVKEIKKFATLHMGTTDVRLDPKLNVQLWKRGVQGVENRMRLRISRKRNDEENAKEKLFALVEPVTVASAKGLHTVVVDEDEA